MVTVRARKACQRTLEVGSARVQHDGCRHEQAHQSEVGADMRLHALRHAGVERDREHHHLHHAESGNGQALHCAPALALQVRGRSVRNRAGSGSRAPRYGGAARRAGSPGGRRPGWRVPVTVLTLASVTPGVRSQDPGDQPAAGGTGQSLDAEQRGEAPAVGASQRRQQLTVVERRPPVHIGGLRRARCRPHHGNDRRRRARGPRMNSCAGRAPAATEALPGRSQAAVKATFEIGRHSRSICRRDQRIGGVPANDLLRGCGTRTSGSGWVSIRLQRVHARDHGQESEEPAPPRPWDA